MPSTRSESTEDHLERIQELVETKGYARVSDIAASLGLSRSAVSNMVRRLARRGFVNYEKYRGLTLTEQGREIAAHVKIRDQTLTQLLAMLGVPEAIARQEVEAVEHHLRPETLRAFLELVRFWQHHPRHHKVFLSFRKRSPDS